MLKVNNELDPSGTSKQGVLHASFLDIVNHFGYPEIIGEDGDKSRVEWVLQDDNRVITIYDWKEIVEIEDVTSWSVGGKSTRDWTSVALLIKGEKS
jgi:hypothetical protein